MIITTNYNIKDWNKIFPDSYNELYVMIDKFLHYVQIMTIKVKVIGERIYQNTGLISGKKYMAKTETVHTRVTSDIKEKAELEIIIGISGTAIDNNIGYLKNNGYIDRIGSNKMFID